MGNVSLIDEPPVKVTRNIIFRETTSRLYFQTHAARESFRTLILSSNCITALQLAIAKVGILERIFFPALRNLVDLGITIYSQSVTLRKRKPIKITWSSIFSNFVHSREIVAVIKTCNMQLKTRFLVQMMKLSLLTVFWLIYGGEKQFSGLKIIFVSKVCSSLRK